MGFANIVALSSGAGSTGVIDTGLVSAVIDVTKSALGLFSVFPLNVFLIASIIGIGIGVFKKMKH